MPNELWAALLGGFLSLCGTVITLVVQQRQTRNEKRAIVQRFAVHQIDYLVDLSNRLYSNFEKHNEVWVEDIDQIEMVMNVIIRNFEHLIFIEDEAAQRDLRTFFTEIFYKSRRAKYWQDQAWIGKRELLADDLSAGARAEIDEKRLNAQKNAKAVIVDMKAQAGDVGRLKARLK